jgi:hypothetical protein
MWIGNSVGTHIRESNIHGLGVFSTKEFTPNVDVGKSHIGIGFINGKLIAGQTTDLGRFQNHSNKPNCINKIVGADLHMVTTQHIYPGDELVVDFHQNAHICINIENSENWKQN